MTRPVGMASSEMRLVFYDPAWSSWFVRESSRIAAALGAVARQIEHIGSTSIRGMLAKPVVDIGVAVPGPEDFEACVEPLSGLGYTYRGQHGEDALRRYFVRDEEGRRLAQLHVWVEGAPAWQEALAFRDLLRTRPDVRDSYAKEKLRVANAVGWDKKEYSIQKGPFIEALLRAEGIR